MIRINSKEKGVKYAQNKPKKHQSVILFLTFL